MAHENINIKYPNFCIGPQAGTFCTIDTTNSNTVMLVKNSSGGTVRSFSLSANIVNEVIGIEYVGPKNLSEMITGLIFFTVEKISNDSFMVRRWELDVDFSQLKLKEQVTKNSVPPVELNVSAFAVESYDLDLTSGIERNDTYIEVTDESKFSNSDRVLIGPSTSALDYGKFETALVRFVGTDLAGNPIVHVVSPIRYSYRNGDPVSVYKYMYIFSSDGYGSSTINGTLYKYNTYNWTIIQSDSKKIYKLITKARWSSYSGTIGCIIGTNLVFLNPRNYFLNWRSMYLGNFASDKNTPFTVYDVAFDSYTIYKLQKMTALVDDSGDYTDYTWTNYNYQEDTLLPYTKSVRMHFDKGIVTGYSKDVNINLKVRDQYNVALSNIEVTCSKTSGDTLGQLDPLDGFVTTDTNGSADLIYTSGSNYLGNTYIEAVTDGGFPSSGSDNVVSTNSVISLPYTTPIDIMLIALKEISGELSFRQINNIYKIFTINDQDQIEYILPGMNLMCKSFFTSPGGDWVPTDVDGVCHADTDDIEEWLPSIYKGDGLQLDAPKCVGAGDNIFSNWPYPTNLSQEFPIPNQIKLVETFSSAYDLKSLTNFYIYRDGSSDELVPFLKCRQVDNGNSLTFSQIKLSLHTYWSGSQAYDYLWTSTNLNQFVFVEDAIPAFWSSKNSIDTNIWIRLRPFAFSLDSTTFKMWIKEVSSVRDTGFYEVTDDVVLTAFDAGGGTFGYEALYNPPRDFDHSAIIFVYIEVYDTAPDPNKIYVEYWFTIIADFTGPYLDNLVPEREEDFVPVDTEISFDILDEGDGINIDTLEVLLNSILIRPEQLNIVRHNKNYYSVSYTPPRNLYFNKKYKVTVKIEDLAATPNVLLDSYNFYTSMSDGVNFTHFDPRFCKHSESRWRSVSLLVLDGGAGVDSGTIKLQVFDQNVDHRLIPIIYRIS